MSTSLGGAAGNIDGRTDHGFQSAADLPEVLPVARPTHAGRHVEALGQLERRGAEARDFFVPRRKLDEQEARRQLRDRLPGSIDSEHVAHLLAVFLRIEGAEQPFDVAAGRRDEAELLRALAKIQRDVERRITAGDCSEDERCVLHVMRVRVRVAGRRQQIRPTEVPLERRRVVVDVLLERLRQRMETRQRSVARNAGRRIHAGQRERHCGVVAGIDPLPQTAELQRHRVIDLPQQRETSTALADVVLVPRTRVSVVHVAGRLLFEVTAPQSNAILGERHVRAGTHAPAEFFCR